MFLTLGQTRFLLNASDADGSGYLNMQLTEQEWHEMVNINDEPVTFGNPGCIRMSGCLPAGFLPYQVFAPSEHRASSLWRSIEDGLKLFGFELSEVVNIVRIPIVVQAAKQTVQHLPLTEGTRRHAIATLIGDAAMTVHFWPGTGLNSGIKSGIALGDEILYALQSGHLIGLHSNALNGYNQFMLRLQDREHDQRSIPILNLSGTPETLAWLLNKAHVVPYDVAIDWLILTILQIATRLQMRKDWHFKPMAMHNIETKVREVLMHLDPRTLQEMAVTFPWPTQEMSGPEILPSRSLESEYSVKKTSGGFRFSRLCSKAKARMFRAAKISEEAGRRG